MKFVVLILVILAVLWWLKQSRGSAKPRDAKPSGLRAEPMVSCAHCGLHLPRREAVAGVEAFYCSDAHRLADGD